MYYQLSDIYRYRVNISFLISVILTIKITSFYIEIKYFLFVVCLHTMYV